jgi:outer membrane protein assembly factor BamB
LVAWCVGAVVCPVTLAAQQGPATTACDWPFIRGVCLDGHSAETDLAEQWPSSGPPVLWTRTLGQGYSSFVAWDDRVATQMQTLGGQYVICLRADTGETLWEYRYDWPYDPAGIYPGPRATPTYDQGRLYFAAPSGAVGCLDAQSGQLLWSCNPVREFVGKGIDFGYSCSPTIADGKVILPVGGAGASMVALDAITGSVVWRSGDDAASYTPAYPLEFRGRKCVLGYLQNALVCHDLQTGERLWRHILSSGYDEHSAWPIYREPYLWIASAFQAGSELLELTGDPQAPTRTVWKKDQLSNDIFSSVLVGDTLFGFDLREAQAKTHRPSRGTFTCMDFATGKVHWTQGDPRQRRTLNESATPSASEVDAPIGHATVIVADGKLILFNDTGELILARARSDAYEVLGRVSVLSGEICWTQPVLSASRLFVRNQSRAACLFLGQPDRLSPQQLGRLLTARDIPQKPYFDMASWVLGVEPEYAFDLPTSTWYRQWFIVSNAILATSLLVVLALVALTCVLSRWRWRWRYDAARGACWGIAFAVGVVGTTLLSHWQGDFYFTWPVSLFVAFQVVVSQTRLRRAAVGQAERKWRAYAAVVFFLVTCAAYFWTCRRLSLVTEWAFLCGFAAALPCSVAGSHVATRSRWRGVWEVLWTCAGFAAYYWSSVLVQVWKG